MHDARPISGSSDKACLNYPYSKARSSDCGNDLNRSSLSRFTLEGSHSVGGCLGQVDVEALKSTAGHFLCKVGHPYTQYGLEEPQP